MGAYGGKERRLWSSRRETRVSSRDRSGKRIVSGTPSSPPGGSPRGYSVRSLLSGVSSVTHHTGLPGGVVLFSGGPSRLPDPLLGESCRGGRVGGVLLVSRIRSSSPTDRTLSPNSPITVPPVFPLNNHSDPTPEPPVTSEVTVKVTETRNRGEDPRVTPGPSMSGVLVTPRLGLLQGRQDPAHPDRLEGPPAVGCWAGEPPRLRREEG